MYEVIYVVGMPREFWVVSKPTPKSELVDICFKTTFAGLMRQTIGSLQPEEVYGIFAEEAKAKDFAQGLLKQRDQGAKS